MTIRRTMTVIALAWALAGCAAGARPNQMTVGADPGPTLYDKSPLRYAVQAGAVSGGSETNPLWKSDVSNDDFHQALEQSLSLHAMLAGTPRYALDAQLVALEHPLIAVQAAVTATVRYTLVRTADRATVWEQTLTTSSTAGFGDALSGPERLRLATERAMHENIKLMLGLVIATVR